MKQPLGSCLCSADAGCGSHAAPFCDKRNHWKHPQTHLHPTQKNMAGCQVHKFGVNNACFPTQSARSTDNRRWRKLLEKWLDETEPVQAEGTWRWKCLLRCLLQFSHESRTRWSRAYITHVWSQKECQSNLSLQIQSCCRYQRTMGVLCLSSVQSSVDWCAIKTGSKLLT